MSPLSACLRLMPIFLIAFVLLCAQPGLAEFKAVEDAGRVRVEPEVLTPGSQVTLYYRNDIRKGREVSLHYGFNGWNLRTSGAGSGSEVVDGNTNYFRRQRMAFFEGSETYQITIDVPAEARALHFVFCWDNCNKGTWDNNNNKDYSRPVVFPYIGPVLTWNHVTKPDRGLVVAFEHPVAGDAWIKYWLANRSSRTLRSTTSGPMHRFQLTDLQPGSRYYYQVGVGTNFRSPTYSFKTLRSVSNLTDLSFLVFGDAQDNGESGQFSSVANAMASQHSDADFVISTGDMPWNDKPGDWWSFFDKGRQLFASKVLMPSLGNHDTPGTGSNGNHDSFLYYFAHPGAEAGKAYYRFDAGPASFFAMNSERPGELQENGAQYLWLRGHLNARRSDQGTQDQPLWAFAYWHISPFNAGVRHWREQFVFRNATKMFAGTLDWHFGGHEHLYQRMKPLESLGAGPVCNAEYGNLPGQGTGYLVVPSGGAFPESLLVSQRQSSELRAILAYPDVSPTVDRVPAFAGFSRVDIRGNDISVRTWSARTASGASERTQLVDEVRYTKESSL